MSMNASNQDITKLASVSPVDERLYNELRLEDFARLFGTTVNGIPQDCRELISKSDFRYRKLNGGERDQVLLSVLKRIDSGQFTQAGKESKARWEKGWAENLRSFIEQSHDLSKLVPKFLKPAQPLRIYQDYAMPADPNFEFNWYDVFRHWLFRTYLEDVETVYEFGCGSGYNLAVLAQLYPDKRLYGLDWAAASKDTVNELGRTYGWNMLGLIFDFFAPDWSIKIVGNSAVLTIGALEQTGRDYESFLQYVLECRPSLCLHVEPIVEWYDESNLIDYVAVRFHRARKYWEGFPNRLRQLENEGKIEILKTCRSYFGSLYHDGYSYLVWRPKAKA